MTKIGVNELGYRVGEDHHRAKFTDHEIEQMRKLRDDGMPYARIACVMECAEATARHICTHRRRAQAPVKFKKVTL